jgi:hypothetical protein
MDGCHQREEPRPAPPRRCCLKDVCLHILTSSVRFVVRLYRNARDAVERNNGKRRSLGCAAALLECIQAGGLACPAWHGQGARPASSEGPGRPGRSFH